MRLISYFVIVTLSFVYYPIDAQIIKDDFNRKYGTNYTHLYGKNYLEVGNYRMTPWTEIYQQTQDSLSLMTDKLIKIAIDSTKYIYDRRSAIFLLGEIGTNKAFQFLLDNFNFFMPKSVNKGDADVMMERPCRYTLYEEKNWALIPVLLKQLEKKKEKWELKDYAELMTWICGQKMAIGMMDGLEKDVSSFATLKLNAFQLKTYLEE